MKLVLVEWIDINATRDWIDLENIGDYCNPLYCRSVGWITCQKNGHIIITPHIGGEKNGDVVVHGKGSLIIPEKVIIKKTILKK